MVVDIRDATTESPLALRARGVVQDGAYSDSLRPFAFLTLDSTTMYSRRAADERAGSYQIEVRLTGYQTWTTSGVQVDRGSCHVLTQHVLALLTPIR